MIIITYSRMKCSIVHESVSDVRVGGTVCSRSQPIVEIDLHGEELLRW